MTKEGRVTPHVAVGTDQSLTDNLETSQFSIFLYWAIALGLAATLFALSRHNYLLFHGLVELTSIGVSLTLFSIGWNTRGFVRNDSLLVLAVAYLSISGIDLLHTLAYKGMGVFPDVAPNFTTQLWIAGRLLEASSYLFASVALGRSRIFQPIPLLLLFAGAATTLLLSIWPLALFPLCFVEGAGLTPFKVLAEYFICFVLLIAFYLFHQKRSSFDPGIFNLLIWSLGATIFSELSFTLYHDVYGFTNFLGHYFKLLSVIFLYQAFVQGTLRTPYEGLFRDLRSSRTSLEEELVRRRNIEEELRTSNRELDTFVRTVSHDLRTPLTPIIGFSTYLREKLAPSGDRENIEILGSIERQGRRMHSLIEDLLALSRVGQIERPPESVDANDILRRIEGETKDRMIAEGITLHAGDLPPLMTHPNFLYQICVNLVSNAIRYAGREGSPLEVGGTRQEASVRYFFRDHGKGIAEKDQEKIFEAFVRGEREDETGGSGLGLAIVQKIARLHGGRAWVEETPGGGSTFWVELRDLPAIRDERGTDVLPFAN